MIKLEKINNSLTAVNYLTKVGDCMGALTSILDSEGKVVINR